MLRAGNRGDLRNGDDFCHGLVSGDQTMATDAVADAAPEACGLELLRKTGDVREAAPLVFGEHIECIDRRHRRRHAGAVWHGTVDVELH